MGALQLLNKQFGWKYVGNINTCIPVITVLKSASRGLGLAELILDIWQGLISKDGNHVHMLHLEVLLMK